MILHRLTSHDGIVSDGINEISTEAALLTRVNDGLPVRRTAHVSGGQEHIVIIDNSQESAPRIADVLQRLELSEQHADVRHVYRNRFFTGFAASMGPHCLDLLSNMSDISFFEPASSVARTSLSRRQSSLAYQTRPNAPWGLQRISTTSTVSGSSQAMDYTYSFANSALGNGADIYIVDTGIYTQHNVFGGRATMDWSYDGNMTDSDGHGTHVSGTAAGSILGVASNANIHGIKALDSDGGGWSSNVIAGIDYVIRAHDARKAAGDSNFTGSVMSMSLASDSSVQAITTAINAAVKAGIHTVVAAGNDGEDACNSSPASSGGTQGPAITVGAVDMNTARSSFSNYGSCVDVYAPGENVISAWIGGPAMVNSLSGTSMATPHVTGIVAYAMGNTTLAADPGLMKEWVKMTGLQLGNGMTLANNGVQADSGDGMLGFEKLSPSTTSFTNINDSDEPRPAKKARRSFSGSKFIGDRWRELRLFEDIRFMKRAVDDIVRKRSLDTMSMFLNILDKVHVFPRRC